jgi:GT2 family glycosyltransferase
VSVRWIEPDSSLRARRGDVVVCIPVFEGHEHFVNCLRSVLEHTPSQVPILICDDASPDLNSRDFVATLESGEHKLFYLRRERNLGFPANVNGAFAACAPADVVVLNSDCVVADGWLEGLRDAVYSDTRIATATALTNHGSVVSVPDRVPTPRLPAEWEFNDAAAAVRAGSLRLRPRLPTAIGHCMWIRRSALELIGDFDLAFSPGYGEEVDLSQRCVHAGLSHVLADDVLVLHHGGGSFSANGKPNSVQAQHERLLAARYPYYHDMVRAVERDQRGPLARSLAAARRSLKGMSVLIDARVLVGPMTGTQLHVLEVIMALARTGEVRLSALVQDDLSDYAARALATTPQVKLVPISAAPECARADIVHRPFQILGDSDVTVLAPLGDRLIVTHQDLIGYHNPTYFRDYDAWNAYRRLTRAALAVADRVVFFSAHARDEAVAEDLVEQHRASVVHIGVDHSIADLRTVAVAPRAAAALPEDAPSILCIGTDFRHKNRLFALRLVERLREEHGWDGYLLLAGPRVDCGSSTGAEADAIARSPALSGAVLDFKAVSEAEKAWLYDRASLVIYPTVHEGFGLVPFEAGEHGVPCMWAHGTSLGEVLPESAAAIVPWNVEESAQRALELLGDEGARERNLAAIRSAASAFTWDAAGRQLLEIYTSVCATPPTSASALERSDGVMTGALSEDAMLLIGPSGALPADLERPLLALATHPALRAPVFSAMKFGYRASYRLRRRARRTAEDARSGRRQP